MSDFGRLNRRTFLRMGALAAATPAVAGLAAAPVAADDDKGDKDNQGLHGKPDAGPFRELEEITIARLQAEMAAGKLTSRKLVDMYLKRIDALDKNGPKVNAILELNPDARAIADALDAERKKTGPRGPLHGIPVLLKDNIDTHDKMQTGAGSLALVGTPALQDATVAARLRAAGAVILGKTNLSEWANFRSTHSSSGWSGRGGQCNNPFVLDRNPCGSSSGSGAAVSANLTVVSLGTETDGSIVCPATNNGVVGIKPTVGLVSRAGVVPISHNQDTVGPHARTVTDAAITLGALVGLDPRDGATAASAGHFHTDYTPFLDPHALNGARIGVARKGVTGYSEKTDAIFEQAIAALRAAGAVIVDPADIPTMDEINSSNDETTVLLFDFKQDLNAYLATRVGVPIKTLADAIAFNNAHADQEMPWFGQELFIQAEATDGFGDPAYQQALANDKRRGGADGIDAVLQQYHLDALVAPTGAPAWTTDLVDGDHFLGASSTPAAIVGYPLVTVPAGFSHGLPVNITFMGTAWSEPTLIKLAYAFEQATKIRRAPQYLPSMP
ncbi:MAG TPA: amidase [Thermomicrobiales bacterium]|nr:amidase [Thermomicrobiales bacterium]